MVEKRKNAKVLKQTVDEEARNVVGRKNKRKRAKVATEGGENLNVTNSVQQRKKKDKVPKNRGAEFEEDLNREEVVQRSDESEGDLDENFALTEEVFKCKTKTKGGEVKLAEKVLETLMSETNRPSANVNCRVESFGKMVANFGEMEKKWVRQMGFEGLLWLRGRGLPRSLCYWVMTLLDPYRRVLMMPGGVDYPVHKSQVSWVFGLPHGPEKVGEKVKEGEMSSVVERLRAKFGKPVKTKEAEHIVIPMGNVRQRMKEPWNEGDEEEFKACFLLVTLGDLLCPTTCSRFPKPMYAAVGLAMRTTSYDWCQLVVDRLMGAGRVFSKKFYEEGFSRGCGGCTYFLALLYLDHLNKPPLDWSVFPRVRLWTSRNVNDTQKLDRKGKKGDYGKIGCLRVPYGQQHPLMAEDTMGPSCGPLQAVAQEVAKMLGGGVAGSFGDGSSGIYDSDEAETTAVAKGVRPGTSHMSNLDQTGRRRKRRSKVAKADEYLSDEYYASAEGEDWYSDGGGESDERSSESDSEGGSEDIEDDGLHEVGRADFDGRYDSDMDGDYRYVTDLDVTTDAEFSFDDESGSLSCEEINKRLVREGGPEFWTVKVDVKGELLLVQYEEEEEEEVGENNQPNGVGGKEDGGPAVGGGEAGGDEAGGPAGGGEDAGGDEAGGPAGGGDKAGGDGGCGSGATEGGAADEGVDDDPHSPPGFESHPPQLDTTGEADKFNAGADGGDQTEDRTGGEGFTVMKGVNNDGGKELQVQHFDKGNPEERGLEEKDMGNKEKETKEKEYFDEEDTVDSIVKQICSQVQQEEAGWADEQAPQPPSDSAGEGGETKMEKSRKRRGKKLTERLRDPSFETSLMPRRHKHMRTKIVNFLKNCPKSRLNETLLQCGSVDANVTNCRTVLCENGGVDDMYVRTAAALYTRAWAEKYKGCSVRYMMDPTLAIRLNTEAEEDPSDWISTNRVAKCCAKEFVSAGLTWKRFFTVFVPVLEKGHWWCVAFCVNSEEVWVLDSGSRGPLKEHQTAIDRICFAVDKFFTTVDRDWISGVITKWNRKVVKVQRQEDGYSCGVYMLAAINTCAERFHEEFRFQDPLTDAREWHITNDLMSDFNEARDRVKELVELSSDELQAGGAKEDEGRSGSDESDVQELDHKQ